MNAAKKESKVYRMRWWILVVISLTVLNITFDTSVLNVALPTLQRELNTSLSGLQWIVDAYMLVFAAILLTMGTLGDRMGRKHMLHAGLVVFILSCLGATFATNAGHLITARAFMGLGSAMILPATLAIITVVFPKEERGKAIGVWAGISGLGIAFGPILGGTLLENFSWTSIFYADIILGVIALLAGLFIIPNSKDPNPKKLDIPGTVLSTATLSIFVFGLIKGGEWGWGHGAVIGTLIASLIIGAVFIWWERKTDHPMLEMGLFKNKRFSGAVGSTTLMTLSFVGIAFALTLYMQFVKGYTPLQTGVRFIPFAAGFMVGAGLSDVWVKRFGAKSVVIAGFLGLSALGLTAAFWIPTTSYLQIGLMLFGLTFCMGNIAAPCADALMGALPKDRAGVGSAMMSVTRTVAGSIGIAALGAVLNNAYTSSIEPTISAIAGLPAEAAAMVKESVGGAMIVAEQLPANLGNVITSAAANSFMDGWQIMAFVMCTVAFIGSLFALRFLPSRERAEETDTTEKAEMETETATT